MFTSVVFILIFNRPRGNFNSENPDFIVASFQTDVTEHKQVPVPLILREVHQLSSFVRKSDCIYLLQTVSAPFLFLFLNYLHDVHLFKIL